LTTRLPAQHRVVLDADRKATGIVAVEPLDHAGVNDVVRVLRVRAHDTPVPIELGGLKVDVLAAYRFGELRGDVVWHDVDGRQRVRQVDGRDLEVVLLVAVVARGRLVLVCEGR